jgi:hypothetical protein
MVMRQHTIPTLTRRSLLGRLARRVLVGAASGSRQRDPVIEVAARTPTTDTPAARAMSEWQATLPNSHDRCSFSQP